MRRTGVDSAASLGMSSSLDKDTYLHLIRTYLITPHDFLITISLKHIFPGTEIDNSSFKRNYMLPLHNLQHSFVSKDEYGPKELQIIRNDAA